MPGREFAVDRNPPGVVEVEDGNQPDIAVGVGKRLVDELGDAVFGWCRRHLGAVFFGAEIGVRSTGRHVFVLMNESIHRRTCLHIHSI